jgi:prefoldin subunit 5
MQASPDIQAPQAPAAPVRVVVTPGVSAPEAVYKAFSEQRRELNNQLEQLERRRTDLANELQRRPDKNEVQAGPVSQALRSGQEARIVDFDKRISDVEKELAVADQQVAKAASVPGAIVEHPREPRQGPPEEVFFLGGMFIVVVFFPLSIAFARRIWKRSAAAVTSFPQELVDRLNRLDQSMDSIAIEVERIGEGQRFVTRVLTDNGRAIGAGPAQPVDLSARAEKARVGGDT